MEVTLNFDKAIVGKTVEFSTLELNRLREAMVSIACIDEPEVHKPDTEHDGPERAKARVDASSFQWNKKPIIKKYHFLHERPKTNLTKLSSIDDNLEFIVKFLNKLTLGIESNPGVEKRLTEIDNDYLNSHNIVTK